MDIPDYSSKEIMQRNMLAAFRLCGEFDGIDGSQADYGAESAGDSDG